MRSKFSPLIAVLALVSCHPQPQREVRAKVVNVYPFKSRYRAGDIAIEFQTDDGVIGRKTMRTAMNHCKIGDTVLVHEQGVSRWLDRKACLGMSN